MIRVYSESLIALEIEENFHPAEGRVSEAIVTAEDGGRGLLRQEVKITFFAEKAKEAKQRLTPGTKFTFRGYISCSRSTGKMEIVGQAFAVIA